VRLRENYNTDGLPVTNTARIQCLRSDAALQFSSLFLG